MQEPIDYDKIDGMVPRLVEAIKPTPPAKSDDPVARAEQRAENRAEYLVAVDVIKLLADIRFRCLVFVTTIAAAASALIPNTVDANMRPVIGLLGLLATLGIAVYELRNSQLYEVATHRAKVLERRLEMIGSSSDAAGEGLFGERPSYIDGKRRDKDGKPVDKKKEAVTRALSLPLMRFWFIPVKHDYGLALIYGAALGAWVYLALSGLLTLPALFEFTPKLTDDELRLIAAGLALVAGVGTIFQFYQHDDRRLKKPFHREVSFTNDALVIHLIDGRWFKRPLQSLQRLRAATDKERAAYRLELGRVAWPQLKEEITFHDLAEGGEVVDDIDEVKHDAEKVTSKGSTA